MTKSVTDRLGALRDAETGILAECCELIDEAFDRESDPTIVAVNCVYHVLRKAGHLNELGLAAIKKAEGNSKPGEVK